MTFDSLQLRALNLLSRWQLAADEDWYDLPGHPGIGCYGTGYNSWGVQTNQKYLSAMAVLGVHGERAELAPATCRQARERALAALRFSLGSHRAGHGPGCTDGTRWGCTWISALGVERMMHGVYLLKPWLTSDDEAALHAMLTAEANWICDEMIRGAIRGVAAAPWSASGANNPESNLWNGALLWRTAAMYPDHPRCADWQEEAHRYLMNSISVAADAADDRVVAGKAIRDWTVGAGFHPNYALDHHGYLNVGYQVICLSNAAMLHFDLQTLGKPAPESLYHHSGDLWQVVRKLIFEDGRLARIGGDSRVRYAYCQEYLLPSLLYAANYLAEPHARALVDAQLSLIEAEAATNDDGSFYGNRLAGLREQSNYYHTRLESDRACVLGMTAAWLEQACLPPATSASDVSASLAGTWCDPDHGVVMVRSPRRLASFAWRAHGYAQGHCQPPGDGHLAEWLYNLGGRLRFMGDEEFFSGGQTPYRRLIDYQIEEFEGGFVTCGRLMEGTTLSVAEGWQGTDSAIHQVAIAALPDDCTMVGMHYCQAGERRLFTRCITGLHLNLPNDLYNKAERTLHHAQGVLQLTTPATDSLLTPPGNWLALPGGFGAVGVYGADGFGIDRRALPLGGRYRSLRVEVIGWPVISQNMSWDPGQVMLDCGWSVLSGATVETTSAAAAAARPLPMTTPGLRGMEVVGQNGRRYAFVANFGETGAVWAEQQVELPPHTAQLLHLP